MQTLTEPLIMPYSVNADCRGIQLNEIDAVWPKAYPHIAKALEIALWPEREQEVLENVRSGKQQLWLIEKDDTVIAAVVTQVFQQDGRKTGCFVYVGGEMVHDWINYLSGWLEWFRSIGCTIAEAHGRIGWKKLLEVHGLKPVATTYRMIL